MITVQLTNYNRIKNSWLINWLGRSSAQLLKATKINTFIQIGYVSHIHISREWDQYWLKITIGNRRSSSFTVFDCSVFDFTFFDYNYYFIFVVICMQIIVYAIAQYHLINQRTKAIMQLLMEAVVYRNRFYFYISNRFENINFDSQGVNTMIYSVLSK